MRRALALSIAAAAAGCNGGFTPYSDVYSLSVLAVKAEPPEIAPGESAQLSALIVDPMGRTIERDWAYCTEPPAEGAGVDVNPDCVTMDQAPFLIPVGQGDTAQVTMPNLPPTAFGLPDATDGFYLPVRMIARAGADQVVTVYRLRYALGGPRNQNPKLADLLENVAPDGTGGMSLPDGEALVHGGSLAVAAAYGPGSAEPYFVLDPSTMKLAPKTELLPTSWFIDAGKLDQETTGPERPVTNWSLGENLPPSLPQTVHLWAVVRDDRGGVDFAMRTLMLQ